MLKIRRSHDRFIFNMGITIAGKKVFILGQGPGSFLGIIIIFAVVTWSPKKLATWRHDIKPLSSLQAICEGNPWLPGIPFTKGKECKALILFIVLAWTSCWTNRVASYLRCHDTHVYHCNGIPVLCCTPLLCYIPNDVQLINVYHYLLSWQQITPNNDIIMVDCDGILAFTGMKP